MRLCALVLLAVPALAFSEGEVEPLPIDPLWKSEAFRRTVTGSYGIDSRIEPNLSVDEEEFLRDSSAALAEGDRGKALAILVGSELADRSPVIRFQIATMQFEEGDLDESIENFRKALDQFPNFRDAHRNLAIALVRKEEFEAAQSHLVRAVELGSREGVTLGLLGYCHSLAENHRAALDAYRLASLTQPDERQWTTGSARALAALGKTEDAASLYRQLVKQNPTDWNSWLSLADAENALEETVPAIANIELVRRSGKASPDIILALGHLYLRAELRDLALARYEEAIGNENPPALESAVDALEQFTSRRDFERAARLANRIETAPYELEEAEEETGTRLLGRLERARALIEIEGDDPEAGAERLRAWIERDPTDGLALLLLARHHENAGAREEAEMFLEQAASLPGHAAEAHKARGKLLVAAGEYGRAIGFLEQSLELEPSESLADYLEAVRELAGE